MALGSDVVRRLGRVFSAQMFSQIATILVQLGLVPILLARWGTDRYGAWLLLSAVPTYLTFSDFGFTFIAKNEMVMAVAAGNRPAAIRTFQSIFVLLTLVGPLVFAAMALLVFLLDLKSLLALGTLGNGDARIALLALIFNVLMYQYALLVGAGIRCENRAATESMWAAVGRLAEGGCIAAAALLGGGIVVAAFAASIGRLTVLLLAYGWMRRASPWLKFGRAFADRAEIGRLFYPALSYMFMPISQALLIQGPVLVLGAVGTALQVVTFSTSRTLSRLGTAATNMLNNSLVTEYSAMAGAGNVSGFRRMVRYQTLASLGIILVYSVAVLLLSTLLMRIFTHGKVAVVQPFFLLMVLGVAAEMIWSALFTPISAVNRHRSVTHWLLGLSIVGVGLCYPAVARFGIEGAAVSILAVHVAMIAITWFVGRPGIVDSARIGLGQTEETQGTPGTPEPAGEGRYSG